MFGKIDTHEEENQKEITERKPNEFLFQQINKTPQRLNYILGNQEKKGLEYKGNAMVEEILNEFSIGIKQSNSGSYSKEFIERSNELINQEFKSIYELIKFIVATGYQVDFFNDFLLKNLNNLPEKTQLRILNEILIENSSYSHLINEMQMRQFYMGVAETTKSEQIADKLAHNKDKYVREQVMYNKNLKKDFMLDTIILRLMDDKDQFVRELAYEQRDKLRSKYTFTN